MEEYWLELTEIIVLIHSARCMGDHVKSALVIVYGYFYCTNMGLEDDWTDLSGLKMKNFLYGEME